MNDLSIMPRLQHESVRQLILLKENRHLPICPVLKVDLLFLFIVMEELFKFKSVNSLLVAATLNQDDYLKQNKTGCVQTNLLLTVVI